MISFNLSSREKRIALATVIVVGSALLYKFLVQPIAHRWFHSGRITTEEKGNLLRLRYALEIQEDVEKNYQTYKKAILAQGSDEEELARFLREIENISKPLDVGIVSMKPLPIMDKGLYKRYTIQVEAEADILNLGRFLYEIKTSPFLIKVRRIQINAKGEEIVRASLQMERFLVEE